jgi:hypothetical protein
MPIQRARIRIRGMLWISFSERSVAGVLLIMTVIVGNSGGGSATAITILELLPWAVPAIVGFIMIAAFGNMLGQLKAIRVATERQAALFQAMTDRRAP